jgi:hypothetical protein
MNDANWTKIIFDDPNFTGESLELPADGSSYEVTLTADILNTILTVTDGWSETAIVFKGQQVIISKITIITEGSGVLPPAETVLYNGDPVPTESWSGNVQLPASAFADAKIGNVIEVTCTDVAAGAQWGIRSVQSSWVDVVPYEDVSGTSYTYTITEEWLEDFKTYPVLFTGHDYTITKIVLK